MRAVLLSLTTTAVLLLLLVLAAGTTAAQRRRRTVECNGTQNHVSPSDLQLYSLGLDDATINFDTLAYYSYVAHQGEDFAEFLNTLNGIKHTVNTGNLSLGEIQHLWNETWYSLGAVLDAEGDTYAADGDNISAASAWHRASNVFQLGGRYDNLTSEPSKFVFKRANRAFVKAISLKGVPMYPACEEVFIPYNGSAMHAYWCPTPHPNPTVSATIVAVNGYDGTAEMQYYEMGIAMLNRGYNVLCLEGPGQGYTARLLDLTFIPEYEKPISAALDFVIANYGVNSTNYIVWGESFGGYLAPRAFAHDARFNILVANGGVLDFYQTILCKFPEVLRDMYYEDTPATDARVNAIFQGVRSKDLGGAFLFSYGDLGFGQAAATATGLFDTLSAYTMAPSMHLLTPARSVFVYDPAWDLLVGKQSELFFAAMPTNSSSSSSDKNKHAIVTLDPKRGAALHCGVGGTANLNIAVARWLATQLVHQ